ncbi:MAG: hypothetical protein LUB59_02210 [Candidatus Gastranaerophilales bacterium]|nr:hypothetical protein [Candidatus Gastranaerophilales bacterium]
MRINTDFAVSANSYPKPGCKFGKRTKTDYGTTIKAADVIPVSGVLGGALMAVYLVKSGKINSILKRITSPNKIFA